MQGFILGISITLNVILLLTIIIYTKFKLMTKKQLKNLAEVIKNDNEAIEDVDCFLDFFQK